MGRIHDAIERWHNGEGSDQQLHEYLGLTWDEFCCWFAENRLPEGHPLIDEEEV